MSPNLEAKWIDNTAHKKDPIYHRDVVSGLLSDRFPADYPKRSCNNVTQKLYGAEGGI